MTPATPIASVKMIALTKIRRDGGTQVRVALLEDGVMDLMEAYRAEKLIPPVIVFFDGTDYWLADGFHRSEAALRLGLPRIAADVRAGTQRDAILYAVGANDEHWGIRRSREDKRKAVLKLLADPEWRKWSDREIARQCRVSPTFAGAIRLEFAVECPDGQSPTARIGGDGRIIETANISAANGKRATPEPPPPPPIPQLSPHDTLALHEISALARLAALCAEFEREFIFIFERLHLKRWGDQRDAAKHEIQRVTEAIERELRR